LFGALSGIDGGNLGMKLKRLRTQRGLSQEVLAKRVKVTQPYLAMLESGVFRNPMLGTLWRLAKALKVTVAELVE
jgi:transcriptional regulator with XRE-family HTH domain